ncbi:MAG: flavodoxin family protein [Thermoprotei archaeon]|mgnify:CR=1 FL=1|nr:MAG: flavodoxin family protein [Thermoprotei archaeon]
MEKPYIIIVLGTPRKYGNTAKIAEIAAEGARSEGANVDKIFLVDYDIKPCIGCVSDDQYACRYPCVIDDDMRKIYDMILKCDGLIIATPIYWYSPSGIVKTFIDRLTVFENMIYIDGKSWVEGKAAGVIAVGNDSGSIELIANLYATLNSMGFVIPPWGLAYYQELGDILENDNACMDAFNVGRVVTLMAKILKREKIEKWYVSDEKALAYAKKKAEKEVKKHEHEYKSRLEKFKALEKRQGASSLKSIRIGLKEF